MAKIQRRNTGILTHHFVISRMDWSINSLSRFVHVLFLLNNPLFSRMLSHCYLSNPNYACWAFQRLVQLASESGTQKGEENRPQNLVGRPVNEAFGSVPSLWPGFTNDLQITFLYIQSLPLETFTFTRKSQLCKLNYPWMKIPAKSFKVLCNSIANGPQFKKSLLQT